MRPCLFIAGVAPLRYVLSPSRLFAPLVALALLGHGWLAPARAQDFADDPVTIVLFAQAVVDDNVVSLQQIARVGGGSESLKKRLARLDVADFSLDSVRTTVTSEQVRFRLLLAGIPAHSFFLEGAKRTTVVAGDEVLSLRRLLGCAEQVLRQRCGDVAMTARRGVIVPTLDLAPTDRVQLEARVHSPGPQAGRARVDVAVLVNGKTCEVVQVMFDLAEPEAVPAKTVHAASPSGPAPRPRAAEPKELLIKSRDNVKMVVNIGSARIIATGEAQQDGALGEVIRVRNVESNRIVQGRVEASGIVLVDFETSTLP